MSIFFWFIDGLGLGADDPSRNPLSGGRFPHLTQLMAGAVALDATLGVPGLPQSATGQTALFTGVNAAAILGRHLNGYPTPTLVRLLRQDNIFRRLARAGSKVTFLNFFSNDYLRLLARHKSRLGWENTPDQVRAFAAAAGVGVDVDTGGRRFRPAASVVAMDAAGIPLRGPEHLAAGEAVPHDVTGVFLRPGSMSARTSRPLSVKTAAATALRAWADHDLTFFETFVTDVAGHRQDVQLATAILERLDQFAGCLLEQMDFGRQTMILVSDHGNIEDLSVRTHTRNPVPLAIAGRGGRNLPPGGVRDLTAVADLIAFMSRL